jgi:bisphosphoglycerate-independent phosphoglycerate mutase (AlkP superfamily)
MHFGQYSDTDRVMSGATAELITHGPDVGLPRGQMGNSSGTPIG